MVTELQQEKKPTKNIIGTNFMITIDNYYHNTEMIL